MIGDKITINGIEYEEISKEEWVKISPHKTSTFKVEETDTIYYKKVKKPTFPKDFRKKEGDHIVSVGTEGLVLSSRYILNDLEYLELVKEAIEYYKANKDVKE